MYVSHSMHTTKQIALNQLSNPPPSLRCFNNKTHQKDRDSHNQLDPFKLQSFLGKLPRVDKSSLRNR